MTPGHFEPPNLQTGGVIIRPAFALVATTAFFALAACGGASEESDEAGAAEPAAAPEPARVPAGRVEDVAARPQGIVYDAQTNLLAVAVRDPDRLLLLDPTTLDVRRTVPLPGKARHLQLSGPGGPVLVPSETANEIIEVSLPNGTTRATKVGRHPHDAAGTTRGDIIVGNEFSGSISVVRDGNVVRTIGDLNQPGSVTTDGARVAVVDVGDYTVSTYDVRAARRIGRVAAGRGPTHGVLAGDGRLAVADTRGDQLALYTLEPLARVDTLDLPGSPYGLAGDPETSTVWVTLTGTNELVGVDTTGASKITDRYPTVRQPNTVAVAPGGRTLWVTGTADGVVQRISR